MFGENVDCFAISHPVIFVTFGKLNRISRDSVHCLTACLSVCLSVLLSDPLRARQRYV